MSYPIWVGLRDWREGEFPDGAAQDVRVIVTAAPLTLSFDDGQSQVTSSDPNGSTATLGIWSARHEEMQSVRGPRLSRL